MSAVQALSPMDTVHPYPLATAKRPRILSQALMQSVWSMSRKMTPNSSPPNLKPTSVPSRTDSLTTLPRQASTPSPA